MFYVEVRATVRRSGPIRLVPLDEIHEHHGFRSVYAFDEETAEQLREQGTTSGLCGASVYAEEILVDFDGRDSKAFRDQLMADGIDFAMYDSGNRSDHYHIRLEPVQGWWVPAAMKEWVKRRAPTADLSFYHPAGMYRLPGTFHWKKPGQMKHLVMSNTGKPVKLDQSLAPAPINFVGAGGSEEELFSLLSDVKGPGQRSPHIWRIATTAAECGKTQTETLELLSWWNEQFCKPPQDPSVLVSQCEKAYKRLARG